MLPMMKQTLSTGNDLFRDIVVVNRKHTEADTEEVKLVRVQFYRCLA